MCRTVTWTTQDHPNGFCRRRSVHGRSPWPTLQTRKREHLTPTGRLDWGEEVDCCRTGRVGYRREISSPSCTPARWTSGASWMVCGDLASRSPMRPIADLVPCRWIGYQRQFWFPVDPTGTTDVVEDDGVEDLHGDCGTGRVNIYMAETSRTMFLCFVLPCFTCAYVTMP